MYKHIKMIEHHDYLPCTARQLYYSVCLYHSECVETGQLLCGGEEVRSRLQSKNILVYCTVSLAHWRHRSGGLVRIYNSALLCS